MSLKSIWKAVGVIGIGLASGWAAAGEDPMSPIDPSYIFPGIDVIVHWLSHLW